MRRKRRHAIHYYSDRKAFAKREGGGIGIATGG
jgi:hypothetical protein